MFSISDLRPAALLATVLLLLLAFTLPGHATDSISWTEDYEEAVAESKRSGKPILVLFTGGDWCGWCKKLDKEVFHTREFAREAGDSFVFLKADFPMYARQASQQKEQNEELKRKHGVRGFPTVILLDEKQQKITSTGYQTGGGKKYAEHLLKILSDYGTYQQNQQRAAANDATPTELEDLYYQAKELGQFDDLDQIITWGSQSEKPSFFLLERYLKVVEEGLSDTEEATTLRNRLLAIDPENKLGNHRRLAVIDFQRLSEQMEIDDTADAWEVCKPLTDYIARWGDQDQDHLWRLQMTVAQTLLNRDHIDEALEYAKNSRDRAPLPMKKAIGEAVVEIEQIKKAANATAVE